MSTLAIVLGDQLNHDSLVFSNLDPQTDLVWMAEVDQEATRVPAHKTRLVLFFSAMRHFRDELIERGFNVRYHELTRDKRKDKGKSFSDILKKTLAKAKPHKVQVVEPGDWFVREELQTTCNDHGVELEILTDNHFLVEIEAFRDWASGKKSIVMETFYRWMRKRTGILIEQGKPVGGSWNFDSENRETFGKQGPTAVPKVQGFTPDSITQEVIDLVESRFDKHPGKTEAFGYPVNSQQASIALDEFIAKRLDHFGTYQDAMWEGTDFLYHSRLSAVINLHLLSPQKAIDAAVAAYESGQAKLNSVEGFVRQILGWREFIRGVYWTLMPEYIERNALGCEERDVPSSYWDGDTQMTCIADSMRFVNEHAYAHHIQRLMVLGLFAQLLGVHPRKFHDWHMAMYADAIDWVSLPNTLGMSQHGDGGVVGTKPYCASGAYVSRMGNYCKNCQFDPKKAVGERACPITTLYWDFLNRHRKEFESNGRMKFQIKNLNRKDPVELEEIAALAKQLRDELVPLR